MQLTWYYYSFSLFLLPNLMNAFGSQGVCVWKGHDISIGSLSRTRKRVFVCVCVSVCLCVCVSVLLLSCLRMYGREGRADGERETHTHTHTHTTKIGVGGWGGDYYSIFQHLVLQASALGDRQTNRYLGRAVRGGRRQWCHWSAARRGVQQHALGWECGYRSATVRW